MAIGDVIHHYRILEPIGKGGMGEVYLAEDTVLDRKVALKFLPESMQQDPAARRRFLREAKAAAALDHPFICRVYDTGETEGKAFIAMEYVTGETLADRLGRGPLSPKEALRIASEVVEALQEAHEKGIIHRDLKPSNIMLTAQGHSKIMDFGLAKQIRPAAAEAETRSTGTSLTDAGMIVGTLAYMSPEQARGEPVDARSDIFSFGVVLYEMLSKTHPFQRTSKVDTLSAILRDPSPPLHMEAAATPPALSELLNKAMAKRAADRYQSARDLAADLQAVTEQLLPRGRPAWITGTLAAAGLLIIALITGLWALWHRAPASGSTETRPPLSVLIADFDNRTGEPVFDAVLEKALEVGLEGAPFITSYNRIQARQIVRKIKPGNDRLDGETARLVAQREGINLVLSGFIDRAKERYRISVGALDPFTGKTEASREARAASKDDVLGAMASVAANVRKQLGDTKVESTKEIAEETFTSSSLEAARSYAVAQDLQAVGKWREAINSYKLAIQLDPDFGRAYAGLAASSANLREKENAKEYYLQAMARIDRMTDREKYRTRSGYYLLMGDHQKAIAELTSLIMQYPADASGLSNLAYALFIGRDFAGALERGRKAVEILPKSTLSRGNLALYAMYAGDFETAFSEAGKVIELNPGYEPAYVCQAVSEIARGRLPEAHEIYKRLAGISADGASLSTMGQADLALYEGKLQEGASILEKGIVGDLANKNPAAAQKLAALAASRLLQGRAAEAVAAAGKAVTASKEARVLFEAANVYLDSGRTAEALDAAKILDARIEPDPQVYAHVIMAKVQLRKGDKVGAIRQIEDTQKLVDSWLGRFELGRAYLQIGAFTEAYSQFERCLKRRGEATAVFLDDVPTLRYLPPVYYYLGRAQEGLKSPGAADSYRTFLAIKEKGGEDPLVVDTRRRLASY